MLRIKSMAPLAPAAALCFSIVSTAQAGDAGYSTWTGPYVGIHIGGSWSDDVLSRDLDGYNGADFSVGGDENIFGGVQLGYNQQFGTFVVGVEGDIGILGVDQSAQFPDFVGVRQPDDSLASVDTEWYGTITGRAGFAFDHFFVYGKGGWSWIDTEVSFIDNDPAGQTLVSGTKTSDTLDGPVYGGGVEVSLGGGASLKAEYLHFDIDESVLVTASQPNGTIRRFDHDIDGIDTVKVGFNLQLHREPEAVPLK